MIKKILESLEDPYRPLLGPNYWLLNKIGLLHPKKFQKRIFIIILQILAIFFSVTLYIELFVIRSDKYLVIVSLKTSMVMTIIVIKIITFVFWQDNWRQIIDYVTDADKFERINQDETRANIIKSYTKYCRRLTYFFMAFVFASWVILNTMPFMYYSSLEFREGVRNGTEAFPHIFRSWMPFDKDKYPGNWITLLWYSGMSAYGSSIMAIYDSSVFVILVFIGGKLELLRARCRDILGTNGSGVSDEQAVRGVKEIHEIHVLLLKHSRLFNSVLSPVMFVYLVMCTLSICTSAYEITSATTISQKILVGEFLFYDIAQLFMFCWHSHDVIHKSSLVMLGPYESEWWAAKPRQRKLLMILHGQMQIELMFTAGPFSNLTLPTFLAILKGAYSYYTLLSTK